MLGRPPTPVKPLFMTGIHTNTSKISLHVGETCQQQSNNDHHNGEKYQQQSNHYKGESYQHQQIILYDTWTYSCGIIWRRYYYYCTETRDCQQKVKTNQWHKDRVATFRHYGTAWLIWVGTVSIRQVETWLLISGRMGKWVFWDRMGQNGFLEVGWESLITFNKVAKETGYLVTRWERLGTLWQGGRDWVSCEKVGETGYLVTR